jgi:hypothetical protein
MSNSNEKDLSSIGQHCSFQSCNRLDFLPVKCEFCFQKFCKEHSSVTGHTCSKYEELNQQKLEKARKILQPIQFYKCVFQDCEQREMVQVLCDFCMLNFCLKHRLPVDHKCAVKNEPIKSESSFIDKSKELNKPEFKFEMKKNVSEKNTQLASKLVLMKLRQTAVGPPGLPELAKYYCFIDYNNEKKPFFFSTKWPVGKCIEFIFDKLKISQSELNKLKLFLNDNLIESSNNIEYLVKNNVLPAPGLTLFLKNASI